MYIHVTIHNAGMLLHTLVCALVFSKFVFSELVKLCHKNIQAAGEIVLKPDSERNFKNLLGERTLALMQWTK